MVNGPAEVDGAMQVPSRRGHEHQSSGLKAGTFGTDNPGPPTIIESWRSLVILDLAATCLSPSSPHIMSSNGIVIMHLFCTCEHLALSQKILSSGQSLLKRRGAVSRSKSIALHHHTSYTYVTIPTAFELQTSATPRLGLFNGPFRCWYNSYSVLSPTSLAKLLTILVISCS